MRTDDFRPEWASAPGETIVELLSERRLSLDDFASKMGMSSQSAANLLEGKSTITVEMARKLEEVLGGSRQFWIARDGQYREDASRLFEKYREWLQEIPIGDMVQFGWIEPVRATDEAASLLRYFGVENVEAWHQKYAMVERMTAFRTSRSFESRPGAVAAWLRQGEIIGDDINCGPWNPDTFRESLREIRHLTRVHDTKRFLPRLRSICAESGVALAVVRSPNGCRASGATRMVARNKVLLQLSFRYLTDDQFWFTFFHEVGHALLHAQRGLFVDGIDETKTAEEREADNFAENTLIPDEYSNEFEVLRGDTRRVLKFAQNVGIAPGIVVGQMQHRGLIPRNWLNALKRNYSW